MNLQLNRVPSLQRINQWTQHWLTGYLVLLVCQAKVFWHYWSGRDLPMGDAAHYFLRTCNTLQDGTFDLCWSPLYTHFHSIFLRNSSDPYSAALSHRLVILVGCSLLIYEIMRRLLPAPFGLLVAVWWLVLPVNFDPLYAVHSFSFLLVLLSWLPLALGNSAWHRSCAIAVLGTAAVLVRNELLVLLAPFTVAVVIWEWRRFRSGAVGPASRGRLMALSIPPAFALAIVLCFAAHADRPFHETLEGLRWKQSFNFGQIYSFVYGKSDPEWSRKDPWTNYEPLVREKFGSTEVTVASAGLANPRAMARHVATNAYLTVGSLQLSLTGARGIKANPDYGRSRYQFGYCWSLSLFCAALLVGGTTVIVSSWRTRRLQALPRPWLWLMLACAGIHGLFVSLLVVPRPAFIFPMNLAVMAAIAMGAHAVCERQRWSTFVRTAIFSLVLIGCFAAPTPWKRSQNRRWNKELVQALIPHKERLLTTRERTVVLTTHQPEPAVMYATAGRDVHAESLIAMLRELPEEASLCEELSARNAWLLHIDKRTIDDPRVVALLDNLGANGWQILDSQVDPRKPPWHLCIRDASPEAAFNADTRVTRGLR